MVAFLLELAIAYFKGWGFFTLSVEKCTSGWDAVPEHTQSQRALFQSQDGLGTKAEDQGSRNLSAISDSATITLCDLGQITLPSLCLSFPACIRGVVIPTS